MNKLFDENGNPKYTNRLSTTTSPYLLQHAHNPVDWYPWGEEALTKARTEDKPILISIGYAACHWCHVMEHESFEDEATAAVMNQHFVNIKVDREERPDLDSIYMSAVQAMTGQGGWPLNCFLLPDGTPFYGGTYYPPDEKASRYRMPSWKQVLLSLADAYQTRRGELVQAGNELLTHMQKLNRAIGEADGQLDYESLFTNAMQELTQNFDTRHGGFGGAPKFPQPMTLEFLLRHHHRHGDQESLHMLELTLHKMALGGMYDQLGGGFHRYSVDAHWLVPHFEKMLYDNALLARMYVEAHQATDKPFYRVIAEETLAYMQREMLHPAGGFYSTQDADSLAPNGHKEEGEFFVWTPEQVREALGEDAALFCTVYDVSRQGNFEGRNILNLPRPLAEVARVTGVPVERIREVIQRGREKLFAVREGRPKPALDDKVLTAWNGMALRAFASAAAAFDNADYLEIARRNANFLLATMRRADGRLLRNWKDVAQERPPSVSPQAGVGQNQSSLVNRQSAIPAFLEDYALLADGLLALYQADGDERWLRESVALADEMLVLFWDEELSGFYDSALDQEQLVVRPRDVGDNATPSGNSVATELLLRLATLTGNEGYRQRAETVLSHMGELLSRFPQGFGRMLCAADFASASVKEVALVGRKTSADTLALQRELLHAYRPHIVVAYAWADGEGLTGAGDGHPAAALLHGRGLVEGRAAAYVCQNFACQLPVTETEGLKAQLA